MFMFDHNCVEIGHNPWVSKFDLAAELIGWAFNPQLPGGIQWEKTIYQNNSARFQCDKPSTPLIIRLPQYYFIKP